MNSRNVMIFVLGLAITLMGSLSSIFWSIEFGIVSLLFLGFILILMLILQRKQSSITQQRILKLIQKTAHLDNAILALESDAKTQTKRALAILQAQQVSLEQLYRELKDGH